MPEQTCLSKPIGKPRAAVLAFMICSSVPTRRATAWRQHHLVGNGNFCVPFWTIRFIFQIDEILKQHFWFMDVYGNFWMSMDICFWWILVDIGGDGTCLQLYGFTHRLIPYINWPRAVKNTSENPEGNRKSIQFNNEPPMSRRSSMIPNLDDLHSCILSPRFLQLQFTSFARKLPMFVGWNPHVCLVNSELPKLALVVLVFSLWNQCEKLQNPPSFRLSVPHLLRCLTLTSKSLLVPARSNPRWHLGHLDGTP